MNTINIKGRMWDLERPVVMGILNLTPDSFFEGNRIDKTSTLLNRAEQMLQDGAGILDLGAYSTRPGAMEVSEAEEFGRILPAVEALVKEFPQAVLSIDTFRSSIAKATIEAGASIINDVSGGNLDEEMFETISQLKVPYILMHMRGTPQNMNNLTHYEHLVLDLLNYFEKKIKLLRQLDVKDIILDPGFGFAKSITQNFELLNSMEAFLQLECPLLIGLSRKSMITKTLHVEAKNALNGTTALNMVALLKGAKILRVHDVKEALECITLYGKLQNN